LGTQPGAQLREAEMTEVAAIVPDTVDRDDIERELRRIFESPRFKHAPVMCGLLSFLVQQTLAGDGDRLKAYTIAVDALGRDADFDTRIDSYPRVQVGRLRKVLDDFYDEFGSTTGLRLHIPKGAYIVGFVDPESAPAEPPRADDASPSAPAGQPKPAMPVSRMADLGRFAAAAIVAALIGLFAWQAFGGLAWADGPRPPAAVETGERNGEYRRCVKVIAAHRCREMLGRAGEPASS
jgi:hypothetical protein